MLGNIKLMDQIDEIIYDARINWCWFFIGLMSM